MKVKKIIAKAYIPTIAYKSDAGFDVYYPHDEVIIMWPGDTVQIKLGIAIEIEEDEVAIMSERSGMAIKYNVTSIGNVIDSGYRGEISIILSHIGNDKDKQRFSIKRGDKVGQIIVHKLGDRNIEVVSKLSDTERGEKAHYSSGK